MPFFFWDDDHAELADELTALAKRLPDAAGSAPDDVRQHMVAVFARLQLAAVEFKDGEENDSFPIPECLGEPAIVAKFQSAAFQLQSLYPCAVRVTTSDADMSLAPYLPTLDGPAAEHGLLQGMARLAELCGWCGRWCAEHKEHWGSWGVEHLALRRELEALHRQLSDLAADAPADAQRLFVQTTVRLAQVAKAFESTTEVGTISEGAAPADVAKSTNAEMQLRFLHGMRADGGAHVCGAAECVRLGAELDAAWLAFPEAERAELMAIPWQNDPEPAVVGWDVGRLSGRELWAGGAQHFATSATAGRARTLRA